ncbi:MAG: protein kinase [Nitrospira sp.]|nr:protein kinase [Nitrospira sp.]
MDRIGPYKIIAGPFAGGFGVVYKVFDTDSGDEFALKTLKDSFLPGSAVLQAFRREVALWIQIPTYPNIVRAIKAFEHGGRPYVLMEWVSGGTLAQALGTFRPKQPELAALVGATDAIEVLRQITDGMTHIHNLDLVHGDLKPSNILLWQRSPQISDFGFARIASSADNRIAGGTRGYMAPELADTSPNELTDIYAAGVMFRKVLTDFAAGEFGVERARKLADRMCSADPGDRPIAFSEIGAELSDILSTSPMPPAIPLHTGDRRSWSEKVIADALPDRQRFNSALTKYTAGLQEAAIEELRAIVAGNPKMVDARILLAEILIHRNETDSAISHLLAAKLCTNDSGRILNIAGLFAEAKQFAQANQMLNDFEKTQGVSPRTWQVRARIADRRGDISGAIDAYREAVRCSGGSDLRYALASLLREAGLIDQAVEEFTAIGRDDRDYGVKVPIMLARIYVDTDRYDDAVDELRACLQRDIGDERAYIYCELGYCYKEQGLYEAASKAYQSALKLDSDSHAAQEGIKFCLEALHRA